MKNGGALCNSQQEILLGRHRQDFSTCLEKGTRTDRMAFMSQPCTLFVGCGNAQAFHPASICSLRGFWLYPFNLLLPRPAPATSRPGNRDITSIAATIFARAPTAIHTHLRHNRLF
jgi:hypothetical protein